MKAKLFFLNLGLIGLIITSCQNDFDLNNPDVDQFVGLLKTGTYFNKVGDQLPNFKIYQIDRLTFYLKDTSVIKMFPVNPISSMLTAPKILNECLLWTIDGIRLGRKYPSLEPCLKDTSRSKSTGYRRLSGKELIAVSEIYTTWYNEYKRNPSETLRVKNLLKTNALRWD
jgi:Domain of unknown function (DUF4943)